MLDWKEHIESDSGVLLGKPVIKGTRISVEFIMERLADDWSVDEIIENYPRVTRESISAVYAFAYEFIKDSMLYSVSKKVA
jgi:uncharacterized protein (DUF433 family)